jgi:BCD family chlorophyll transporter-like MFS transporter
MNTATLTASASLSWLGIARLGLVKAMLGAVVVLTTSPRNRVMVAELALPALLSGLLSGVLVGFAVGGHFGTAASEVARWLIGQQGTAHAAVFFPEAGMFIAAPLLATRIAAPALRASSIPDRSSSAASAAPLVGSADVQALRAGGSS